MAILTKTPVTLFSFVCESTSELTDLKNTITPEASPAVLLVQSDVPRKTLQVLCASALDPDFIKSIQPSPKVKPASEAYTVGDAVLLSSQKHPGKIVAVLDDPKRKTKDSEGAETPCKLYEVELEDTGRTRKVSAALLRRPE